MPMRQPVVQRLRFEHDAARIEPNVRDAVPAHEFPERTAITVSEQVHHNGTFQEAPSVEEGWHTGLRSLLHSWLRSPPVAMCLQQHPTAAITAINGSSNLTMIRLYLNPIRQPDGTACPTRLMLKTDFELRIYCQPIMDRTHDRRMTVVAATATPPTHTSGNTPPLTSVRPIPLPHHHIATTSPLGRHSPGSPVHYFPF